VPISRPDDFFAEMMKNDTHMVKVKSRLLRQQVKIKTFEEKKVKAGKQKVPQSIEGFQDEEQAQPKARELRNDHSTQAEDQREGR